MANIKFTAILYKTIVFVFILLGTWACSDSKREPDVASTLLQKLNEIDGVVASKKSSPFVGYDYYALEVTQPLDHDAADGDSFSQKMRLYIKDIDNPLVLHTAGYMLSGEAQARLLEPTSLFGANQLDVEHRYFGESAPDEMEWDYLNIRQASADLHRIITLLKPLLGGKWLSSGHSKGGMTAVFHRRFYPEDVDGTLAYVAPLFNAVWDERFAEYSQQVVSSECLTDFKNFQLAALDKLDELTVMFEQWASDANVTIADYGYTPKQRMEAEIVFSWIYVATHVPDMGCGQLPPTDATAQTYFDILKGISQFSDQTAEALTEMLPYHMQAATELGNYSVPLTHLQERLSFDVTDFSMLILDQPMPLFKPEIMMDIQEWAQTEARRIIFVYGEQDYTTAATFPVVTDPSRELQRHIAAGLHSIQIESLPEDEKALVMTTLESWLK